MQVNFTGTKNISTIILKNNDGQYNIVNAQLTNDQYGNDLDEYKNLLRKNPNNLHNPVNSEFINITTINGKDIYFNHKRLEINDSNLPIITYMAKITKNIANKDPQKFINKTDYVTSEEFWDSTFNDRDVSTYIINTCAEQKINILGAMTNPDENKKISGMINNEIVQKMAEYFDVTI